MTPSSVITQHVTSASGTIAIASSSTSIGVSKIVAGVPHDPILLENIHYVVSNADKIALFSAVVMLLSFLYNVWSSKKQRKIDQAFCILRNKEYQLELAKFEKEIGVPNDLKE